MGWERHVDELHPYHAAPRTAAVLTDSWSTIEPFIDTLPEPQQEVLRIHLVEGASYREVAERLAIPLGTVHSRVARAKRRIRAAALQRTTPADGFPSAVRRPAGERIAPVDRPPAGFLRSVASFPTANVAHDCRGCWWCRSVESIRTGSAMTRTPIPGRLRVRAALDDERKCGTGVVSSCPFPPPAGARRDEAGAERLRGNRGSDGRSPVDLQRFPGEGNSSRTPVNLPAVRGVHYLAGGRRSPGLWFPRPGRAASHAVPGRGRHGVPSAGLPPFAGRGRSTRQYPTTVPMEWIVGICPVPVAGGLSDADRCVANARHRITQRDRRPDAAGGRGFLQ